MRCHSARLQSQIGVGARGALDGARPHMRLFPAALQVFQFVLGICVQGCVGGWMSGLVSVWVGGSVNVYMGECVRGCVIGPYKNI